jgi:MYXO-CTERM domain-containing protein
MRYRLKTIAAALMTAAFVTLAAPQAAHAELIIDFDNVFDGGTITSLGGGEWKGEDIIFTTINLVDTSTATVLLSAQCGNSTDPSGAYADAKTSGDACLLDFNTATGLFQLTAPNGVYADLDSSSYNGALGSQIVGDGQTVLESTNWDGTVPFSGLFAAAGTDSKNAALLRYFGITATNFSFLNSDFYVSATGAVTEADLTNSIPEPGLLTLFGLGLLGVGRKFARRRTVA